jgi:ketosteroid isomerase-like protein
MPTWLSEDPTPVYVILGVVGLALLVGYWNRRKRAFLIGLGVVAGLVFLAWLISFLIVTDSEQIRLNLEAMERGVNNHDTEAIFKHVAKDFHIAALDKEGLKQLADRVLHNNDLKIIQMWEYDRAAIAPSGASATITFMVKPKGDRNPQEMMFRCNATFVREADGKWRLKGFELRDPVNNESLVIPEVQH